MDGKVRIVYPSNNLDSLHSIHRRYSTDNSDEGPVQVCILRLGTDVSWTSDVSAYVDKSEDRQKHSCY